MRLFLIAALLSAAACGSSEEGGKGTGGAAGSGSGGASGSGGSTGGGAGTGSGGASGSGGQAGSDAGITDGSTSDGSTTDGGTPPVIDASTLNQKLMFGYQGWFLCPGDGSPPNRWVHWFKSQSPVSTQLSVDMWPDTSELDPDELFDTELTHASGKKAQLYSAYPQKTVVRHFKWMKDAGIDGVFVQRFLSELTDPAFLAFRDQVAKNARAGAEAHGRTFVIMYDISGANASTLVDALKKDWAHLVGTLQLTASDRYQKHSGRPLLAIWGLGFSDRPGTAAQAAEIVSWFKSGAPAAEQVTLMGGVPTHWRTLTNDSKTDAAWANVYASFDVVSPWSVGRYADDAGADDFKKNLIVPDLAYAQSKNVGYMPVIFPGFSWKNLNGGALNQIPRKGGAFWWRQLFNAQSAGSSMVYGAMFDEVDEGTAMFKLAPNAAAAPTQGSFVTLGADGQTLPSDWYLRLAGAGSKMMRGELPLSSTVPISP